MHRSGRIDTARMPAGEEPSSRYGRFHLAALLPAIGWLWLVGLTILSLFDRDIRRHHFESAGLVFGIGLLAFVWATRTSRDAPRPHSQALAPVPLSAYAIPAVVSLLAFAWTIRLGPLSDDFVLRAWADAGQWTPDGWIHLRPLPLALWQALTVAG